MQLPLSITLVFFMITGTLCRPEYQQLFSEDAHQNETETEITTTDEIDSVKLDVDNATETRNETLEELQQSTTNSPPEHSTYPPQHESKSEPESREPIENPNPPSRSLTVAELYDIKSLGERVAAWTPESGVYPHELGNDMVLPLPEGEFITEYIPREEPSKYRLENVMEITPDVILLVGKKIRPVERVMYSEQSYNGVRTHEQSGILAEGQIISVDKLYTRPSEYRIHIEMPHDIRPVVSYVRPYPGISLHPVYQGNYENRYEAVLPDGTAEYSNVNTRTSKRRSNPDEEMNDI